MKRLIFALLLFVVGIFWSALNAQNTNTVDQAANKLLEVERLMNESDYVFEGTLVEQRRCLKCEPVFYSNRVKVHKVFKGSLEYGSIEIMCTQEEKEQVDSPFKEGQQGLFFACKNGPEMLKLINDNLPNYAKQKDIRKHWVPSIDSYNNPLSLEATFLPYKTMETDDAVVRFSYNSKPQYFQEVKEVYPLIERACEQTMIDYDEIVMSRRFLGRGTPLTFQQRYSIRELKEKLGFTDDCYDPRELVAELNQLLPIGNEFVLERDVDRGFIRTLKFSHFYKGVEVNGSGMGFDLKDCVVRYRNRATMLHHPNSDYIDVDSARSIAIESLESVILTWETPEYENHEEFFPEGKLYWDRDPHRDGSEGAADYYHKDWRLIYSFEISTLKKRHGKYKRGVMYNVIVDANTGEITRTDGYGGRKYCNCAHPKIQTHFNGMQTISVDKFGTPGSPMFEAIDKCTRDEYCNPDCNLTADNENGFTYVVNSFGDPIFHSDTQWGWGTNNNEARLQKAGSLLYGFKQTAEYWKQNHEYENCSAIKIILDNPETQISHEDNIYSVYNGSTAFYDSNYKEFLFGDGGGYKTILGSSSTLD